MRQNAFGDYRIDSPNDDLGSIIDSCDVSHSDVYAMVHYDAEKEKWAFEVLTSDEGDEVASSDAIFESELAVCKYLGQWLDQDVIDV